MTKNEFAKCIKILVDVFGKDAWPQTKVEIMWNSVEQLNHDWFRRQVDSAVLAGNARYNFQEAIVYEKRNRAMNYEIDKIAEREKLLSSSCTDAGYEKVLKAFKANNLLEAIDNAMPSKTKLIADE